jgi:hypothetical protein
MGLKTDFTPYSNQYEPDGSDSDSDGSESDTDRETEDEEEEDAEDEDPEDEEDGDNSGGSTGKRRRTDRADDGDRARRKKKRKEVDPDRVSGTLIVAGVQRLTLAQTAQAIASSSEKRTRRAGSAILSSWNIVWNECGRMLLPFGK